jgi:hypothetical protein
MQVFKGLTAQEFSADLMARRGLAFDQRDASSLSGERDGSGTACHSTTEDENFILQGIAPDSRMFHQMCSWIPYFYLW